MADGAVRLARGAYDIGLKIRIRTLLENRNRRFRGAGRVSSLSVGLLLENTGNANGNGTKSVSDLTAALPWDNYARVKPQDADNQRELRTSYKPKHILSIQNGRETCSRRFNSRNSSNLIFIRAYSGNGYREPLYKSKTAYYDILGVSGSATHSQIKTAYYKQSFMYHPDRNAGSEEATLRFSDINEAYTVLGNKALRKKYDRGLLSSSDLVVTARPSTRDAATASSSTTKRHSDARRSVVDPDGSARVFDFDKFYKAHYGEQLQRERDIRVRKEEMQKKEQGIVDQKMEMMMEVGVGALLLMALGILLTLKRG